MAKSQIAVRLPPSLMEELNSYVQRTGASKIRSNPNSRKNLDYYRRNPYPRTKIHCLLPAINLFRFTEVGNWSNLTFRSG